MFQYRQVLLRLRQGDSDRDIARSRLMGRPKVAVFRLLADAQGLADSPRRRCPMTPRSPQYQCAASCEQHDFEGRTVSRPSRALGRSRRRRRGDPCGAVARVGFRGSYSAVRRMLAEIHASAPPRRPSAYVRARRSGAAGFRRGSVSVSAIGGQGGAAGAPGSVTYCCFSSLPLTTTSSLMRPSPGSGAGAGRSASAGDSGA